MKSKVPPYLLFMLLITILWACGPSEVDVNGEVFIVTQGGPSIKLALVEVGVIAEPNMITFIQTKRDNAIKNLEELKTLLENQLAAVKQAEKAYDDFNRANPNSPKLQPIYGEDYRTKRAAYIRLEAQYSEFFDGQYWIKGLPLPTQVVKSDGDGKFVIKLNPGRYGIVATANRRVANKTEEYYWILWTNVLKKQTTKLLLSNDNLLDRDSASCAVPFNMLPVPLVPLDKLLGR